MTNYADPLDAAEATQAQLMTMRIASIRNQGREIMPMGVCHNCGEPLESPKHLFCDMDCSHDYERLKNK